MIIIIFSLYSLPCVCLNLAMLSNTIIN
jgi:hypothetical protein